MSGEQVQEAKWVMQCLALRTPPTSTSVNGSTSWRSFVSRNFRFGGSAPVTDVDEVLSIDLEEWKKEVLSQDAQFLRLHDDLPVELHYQRELLISRL
jgi:GTP-dependent phosphoenolpyruvate carboxykinase